MRNLLYLELGIQFGIASSSPSGNLWSCVTRWSNMEFRFEQGLADTYGELVPDGSSDAITIVFGQRSKTVEIHFLMNWVNEAPHRLKEPSRAIRILLLTHAWLNDFEELGIDRGRQQYEMVLDAME
jgi:hypothetical protein